MSDQNKLSRRDFIKGAAIGAAAVAGAGVLGVAPVQAQTPASGVPTKWDYEADVVVVGAGFAAQGAALEAADGGAKVLVLEKAPRNLAGGSSCVKVNFSSATIGSSIDVGIEYLKSECWGTVDDADTISDTVKAEFELAPWIEKLGGTVVWSDCNVTYPTLPGGDKWGGPAAVHAQFSGMAPKAFQDKLAAGTIDSPWQEWMMTELFPARKIDVMCDTPATELIQDPVTNEILGVKALTGVTTTKDFHYTGGKEIYVKAKKGVVLACGGYENNWAILNQFGPHPHSAYVTFYGSPFSTGDGVTMSQKVGAQLWHMNKTESHNMATTVGSKEIGAGRPVNAWATGIANGPGILVNRDGKRFMNEYHWSGHSDNHREYHDFEHMRQPADDYDYTDYRNTPFYWIFDDTTMKKGPLGSTGHFAGVHKIHKWSNDNLTELNKGWFVKADTIEALAKLVVIKDFFGRVVGMNAAGLVAEVNKYNGYAAAGKDLDFSRRPSMMAPIVKPPFYAMEVCECQTNTQGGPKHNRYSQILDLNNKPIPRLYGAGEFGSIFGFLYNGAGNLAEALAMGRVAGKHAASLKPWGST